MVRDRGTADLRIVTVVAAIVAANEARGWHVDWRKTFAIQRVNEGGKEFRPRKFARTPCRGIYSRNNDNLAGFN